MTPQRWPPRDQVIDEILAIAESYARSRDNLDHPEDIAVAIIAAVEVAWRAIKPEEATR